jgi:hypothetical protein
MLIGLTCSPKVLHRLIGLKSLEEFAADQQTAAAEHGAQADSSHEHEAAEGEIDTDPTNESVSFLALYGSTK